MWTLRWQFRRHAQLETGRLNNTFVVDEWEGIYWAYVEQVYSKKGVANRVQVWQLLRCYLIMSTSARSRDSWLLLGMMTFSLSNRPHGITWLLGNEHRLEGIHNHNLSSRREPWAPPEENWCWQFILADSNLFLQISKWDFSWSCNTCTKFYW